MPSSTSRLSYSDCYEFFEAAQRDTRGARKLFPDRKAANTYRLRMNTARSLDRKDNAAVYATDHPLHGRSPFDQYVMTLHKAPDGPSWYLVVELYATEDFIGTIEPLSTVSEPKPWPISLEPTSISGDELADVRLESPSPPTTLDGSKKSSTPLRRRLPSQS